LTAVARLATTCLRLYEIPGISIHGTGGAPNDFAEQLSGDDAFGAGGAMSLYSLGAGSKGGGVAQSNVEHADTRSKERVKSSTRRD